MRTIEKHSLTLSGTYKHNASCQTLYIFSYLSFNRMNEGGVGVLSISHKRPIQILLTMANVFNEYKISLWSHGKWIHSGNWERCKNSHIAVVQNLRTAWIPFFCLFAAVGWKHILCNLLRERILFQQWREMQLKWKFEDDLRFNSKESETWVSLGIGKTYEVKKCSFANKNIAKYKS